MTEYVHGDVKSVSVGEEVGIHVGPPVATVKFNVMHAGWYLVEVEEDGSYMIRDIPAPKRDWIPVEKRLPEEACPVLATVEDENGERSTRVASMYTWRDDATESGWAHFWFASPPGGKVIAWMPIPEPWKGEQDA